MITHRSPRGVAATHPAASALVLAVVAATAMWASASQAAFFGLPKALTFELNRINFQAPVLAPIGHTRFCMQYRDDCEVHRVDFRQRNIALTPQRLAELSTINREVNREITPQREETGPAAEIWQIAPEAGNCHDYAVTKRHELLERGWPSRALLLSEVVTNSGEHHLVLIVRTKDVDLVLDNLNANVRPVGMTRYRWLRAESPADPKYWSAVSVPAEMHTAMLRQ